jgi:hypothetical protein
MDAHEDRTHLEPASASQRWTVDDGIVELGGAQVI